MSFYYRLHPWLEAAGTGEKGHPLYVPPNQGAGRIDNPDEYQSFYVSDTATGAIAEAFGDNAVWTPDLFKGPSALSGSVIALTQFEGSLTLVDLDDPSELVRISVKPSRVVTRHRQVTQAWALALFETRRDEHGVKWWSYHEPEWTAIGLWDFTGLTPVQSTALDERHPAFVQARRLLARPWQN